MAADHFLLVHRAVLALVSSSVATILGRRSPKPFVVSASSWRQRRNQTDRHKLASRILAPCLFFSAEAMAAVRYVNSARPDDSGDGLSWAAAKKSLRGALDAAIAGDEIWVAAGTYRPTEKGCVSNPDCGGMGNSCDFGTCSWNQPRTQTFTLRNGIAVYGGFTGTETLRNERDFNANPTILSGDISGNDALVSCNSDAPDCSALGGRCLEGFCVIPGNNSENSFHVVSGPSTNNTAVLDGFVITGGNANTGSPNDRGAAVYNNPGSPTIRNSDIRRNYATLGGGMYNGSGSSAAVIRCTFQSNAASHGGGLYNSGGASTPAITSCTFSGNSAAINGGGVYNDGVVSLSFVNSVFTGNAAAGDGGGMNNFAASPTVTNCTFAGNRANGEGGGIYQVDSFAAITNNILWGNLDDFEGGVGGPFSDETAQVFTASGTPTLDYSLIQGGWSGSGGAGIIDADPLFQDADGPDDIAGTADDNLRLRADSPAIDAGNNSAWPGGVLDRDDNPRFVDNPFVADTGVGSPPIIDLGAYEQAPDVTNCQYPQSSGNMPSSDRGVLITAADDFVSAAEEISSLIWWGAYVTINTSSDCAPGTGDDFQLKIYSDIGNLPGTLLATRTLSATKAATGQVLNSQFAEYVYTAAITPVIQVTPGQCYWMEITNQSVDDCRWYRATSALGNGHAAQDTNNGIYEPWEYIYSNDFAFCFDGMNIPGHCGEVLGQCCHAPGACEMRVNSQCPFRNWRLDATCDPNPCSTPANHECSGALPITDGETEYDTWFAPSVPQLNCGGYTVRADIWYEYTAPCTGTLTVNLCEKTNHPDPVVAVYGTGSPGCSCPPASTLDACEAESCVFNPFFPEFLRGAYATLPVTEGNCYLIQIGGTAPFGSASGYGTIEITCDSVIRVDAAATGNNDGTSWADAFTSLQDALNASALRARSSGVSNTEIWVAAGTYKPDVGAGITPGDRTATFQLQNGVALYGGFAGTETSLSQLQPPNVHVTTLSGDLSGNDADVACTQNSPDCDSFGGLCAGGFCVLRNNNVENSYHVVTAFGVNSTAKLQGFTITAGNANGTFPHESGGGIYIGNGSAPSVTQCTFTRNSAVFGGGMRNLGSPTISDCAFDRNAASDTAGGMANGGDAVVLNCSFTRNAGFFGGGMANNFTENATVSDCAFGENVAHSGGGMLNVSSSPSVINCTFTGNSAFEGGGMKNTAEPSGSNPMLVNCTFSGNLSTGLGGGMLNDNSNPTITNCTLSGNSSSSGGGGLYNRGGGNPTLTNCILWSNSDPDGMGESAQLGTASGTPTVNYSIVMGGWNGAGGVGIVNADPLFFDPDGIDGIIGTADDDLRLRPGSPAIDAGDTTALPPDTFDLDGDGDTTEYIPVDLAGYPRQFDDPDTPDTGIPGSPVVDMGAYEYFTDCNLNGVLDSVDNSSASSLDCNSPGWASNGIPDECDIAACSGNPGCDDCNLNGIPDGCDIGAGSSQDVDLDGVPDECVHFTGNCAPPTDQWSCFDNWDLPGDIYPDNVGGDTYSVILTGAGDSVCLDVNVTIDTMRMDNSSALRITQPDPPCGGGASNAASGPATSLHLVEPGGLLVESSLTTGGNNEIVVNGSMVIGPDGVYEPDPSATGFCTASLSAGSLSLLGNDCASGDCPDGGRMVLDDAMSVLVSGDLVIDGRLANGDCQSHQRSSARSFHTPPSLQIVGPSSSVGVGGTTVLSGAAGFESQSLQAFIVGGDWQNHSVRPDCFHGDSGVIRMEGLSPQVFEVAATDVGEAGLMNGAGFVIGRLEIAAGSHVTLVDAFDNDQRAQASCGEAQYVGTLVLEAGATLVLQNCRIYCGSIIQDPSASILFTGCGEARVTGLPDAVAPDPSGLNKPRSISVVPPASAVAGTGAETAIRVRLDQLHHVNPPYTGGPTVPFTSFEGQVRYAGPPTQYVESNASGTLFYAANLQCQPHYQDWSTVGLVHVFGSAIVPSSSYQVEVLAASCNGIEASCTAVSAPLMVSTTRWGDVEVPFNPPDPTAQPNASDIGALVNKFRGALGAPIKARALLTGSDQFGNISIAPDFSFIHIASCVDAFRGLPYPFTIQNCP